MFDYIFQYHLITSNIYNVFIFSFNKLTFNYSTLYLWHFSPSIRPA